MSDRFRVSRVLARQLQEQNVSVAAVLRHARLPEGFFDQEKILVSTEELFALWRAVAEISGDPAVGLKLGGDVPAEGGAPQTIAALHSESFLDALQRMARYKKLTCPEEIRLRCARDECAVEFVFLLAEQMEPPVLVDVCLSWILSIGRRGTGIPVTPLRLELTRRGEHRPLLEAHYGCRVKFQAERNALVFRPSDLERLFVTHNPELLAMLGSQFEAELNDQQSQRSVGEEVKVALKRLLSGRRPSLGDVARTLGLSARTLQRRLTENGLTFQQLLQETRRDLAHHYLKQSRLELKETAYLLGFDDANSFFRAFQRWEGTSPRRWRSRHQPGYAEPLAEQA
jgi:AraC-like DNA-binding protein